jgi:hypothetical protein
MRLTVQTESPDLPFHSIVHINASNWDDSASQDVPLQGHPQEATMSLPVSPQFLLQPRHWIVRRYLRLFRMTAPLVLARFHRHLDRPARAPDSCVSLNTTACPIAPSPGRAARTRGTSSFQSISFSYSSVVSDIPSACSKIPELSAVDSAGNVELSSGLRWGSEAARKRGKSIRSSYSPVVSYS